MFGFRCVLPETFFFFLKIEKRQKQGQSRPLEPELRKFEPEGGKQDLAHLSGPLSQKRFFFRNRKTPKTGPKQAPGAQTPKIRTRRGETGPGASFWTPNSKTDFSENRKTSKNPKQNAKNDLKMLENAKQYI